MRTKLWLFSGFLVFATVVAVTTARRPSPAEFAVRVVGRTNDAMGQLHLYYEITNITARELHLALAEIEAKTETGWHQASNSQLQEERGKSRYLYATSNAVIHIVAPAEGSAVRGEAHYAKRNLWDKFRWQVYCWGLPMHFCVSPVLGEEYRALPLPEVQKSGDPFLIIPAAMLELERYRVMRMAPRPADGSMNPK
jgi:hypothetical protein